MSDKQLIGVIAERLHDEYCDESECDEDLDGFEGYAGFAEVALAALREAGWDVYRPEECVEAALRSLSLNLHQSQRLGFDVVSLHQVPTPVSLSSGGEAPRYRLVPVEGD